MRGRLFVIFLAGAVVLGAAAVVWFLLPAAPEAPPAAPERTEAPPPVATPRRSEPPATAPSRPASPVPPPAAAVAPTTGTLRIESDVPGASVFIDRVYLGTTPITVPNVALGEHRLTVSADGYDSQSETIDVAAGSRDITIAFKEIRLNQTLEAVHKHSMGSCKGTLVATPQGLRYDTTDAGDAFSVPLTDLEIFEFDYLTVNLKIKIRSGKTFNFTSADKNADRLLVFHREVDKIIKRVKGSH